MNFTEVVKRNKQSALGASGHRVGCAPRTWLDFGLRNKYDSNKL